LQASEIAQAEQAVAQSRARRDQILIQARTREADAQSASAEQARVAAEKARAQAEAASELAQKRLAAANLARGQAESALQEVAAAKTRAGTLEAELAELKARKTDRGMVLTLGDVLFDFGQTTLKPGATRTIGQLAEFLTKNPRRNVLIEGHTDSVGGEEFNRELSQRRAEAVREALIELRIGGERVEVSGLGKDYPVASNDTPAGRQQNRRVEVIFSDDSGAIQQRK